MCPWYSSRASGSWSSLYNRMPLSLSVATCKHRKRGIGKESAKVQWRRTAGTLRGRSKWRAKREKKLQNNQEWVISTLFRRNTYTEREPLQALILTPCLVEGIKRNAWDQAVMENSSRLYISTSLGGREERKEQLMAYGVWKPLHTSARGWADCLHS